MQFEVFQSTDAFYIVKACCHARHSETSDVSHKLLKKLVVSGSIIVSISVSKQYCVSVKL